MAGNNSQIDNNLAAYTTKACPECREQIRIVLHQQAIIVACASCSTYCRYNSAGVLRKIDRFTHVADLPVIPLYSKGTINGVLYEIVGYMIKREKGTDYEWREYLLFNPYQGYVTLAEYNGHWNFVYQLNKYPREVKTRTKVTEHAGKEFRLYNKYKTEILYAAGEFYYNINKEAQVSEFIHPPFMLVYESENDEERWYFGEYLNPQYIKKTFSIGYVPAPTGVGANQLMRSGVKFNTLKKVTGAFIALMLLLQFYFSFFGAEKNLFRHTYYEQDRNKEKAIITPSIELTGRTSAVRIDISSPLSNNWIDIDVELVDDLTGKRFEAVKSLEFYSGYDDGAWSEGSQDGYVILSSVPAGKYHMNIYPEWGTTSGWNNPSFTINVKQGVPLVSNFFIVMIIGCLFPAIQYYRERSFETRRWMNSNYAQ